MSSDPENLSTPKSGEAFAWYKVWYKVLTKPMASNLEQFLEAPSTTAIQALFLIYIPSLIFFELLFLGGDTQNEFGALAVAVIFVPILALFQLLTITVFISGIRLITKWFGGNSSFSNLFYANAAYYFLILLIVSVFAIFLPLVYLMIIFGISFLVINIFIVKNLYHFGRIKALVSSIGGAVLVGIFFAGLVLILQVFSLINVYMQAHPVTRSVPVESLSPCMNIEILNCDWDLQGRLTNNCGQEFESVKIKAMGILSQSGSKVENEREYSSFSDNNTWTFLIRLKPPADEQVINCEVVIEKATKVR